MSSLSTPTSSPIHRRRWTPSPATASPPSSAAATAPPPSPPLVRSSPGARGSARSLGTARTPRSRRGPHTPRTRPRTPLLTSSSHPPRISTRNSSDLTPAGRAPRPRANRRPRLRCAFLSPHLPLPPSASPAHLPPRDAPTRPLSPLPHPPPLSPRKKPAKHRPPGAHHTVCCARSGALYSWGAGKYGVLGHGGSGGPEEQPVPRRVEFFINCEGAPRRHSGQIDTLAVLPSLCPLPFLPRAPLPPSDSAPEQLPPACPPSTRTTNTNGYPPPAGASFAPDLSDASSDRVVAVACGGSHSCAATASGALYAWGWGGSGQLGHGAATDEHWPHRVRALEHCAVVSVSCGA